MPLLLYHFPVRCPFVESGTGLHSYDGLIVELFEVSGSNIGHGGPESGHAFIDHIPDRLPSLPQVYSRSRDPFLEEGPFRLFERGESVGPEIHRLSRCHSVVFFVHSTVPIIMDISGRFVGPGKEGSYHHMARSGGEREADIPRCAYPSVGPDESSQFSRLFRTMVYGGELGSSYSCLHPSGAHGARTYSHLHPVGPGLYEIMGRFLGDDIPRYERGMFSEFLPEIPDSLHHLFLVSVSRIENENFHSHIYHSTSFLLEIIDTERDRYREFSVGTEIRTVDPPTDHIFLREYPDKNSSVIRDRKAGNALTIHQIIGILSRYAFHCGDERRFPELPESSELVDSEKILFFENPYGAIHSVHSYDTEMRSFVEDSKSITYGILESDGDGRIEFGMC